jgi:hypothetical protein
VAAFLTSRDPQDSVRAANSILGYSGCGKNHWARFNVRKTSLRDKTPTHFVDLFGTTEEVAGKGLQSAFPAGKVQKGLNRLRKNTVPMLF